MISASYVHGTSVPYYLQDNLDSSRIFSRCGLDLLSVRRHAFLAVVKLRHFSFFRRALSLFYCGTRTHLNENRQLMKFGQQGVPRIRSVISYLTIYGAELIGLGFNWTHNFAIHQHVPTHDQISSCGEANASHKDEFLRASTFYLHRQY